MAEPYLVYIDEDGIERTWEELCRIKELTKKRKEAAKKAEKKDG